MTEYLQWAAILITAGGVVGTWRGMRKAIKENAEFLQKMEEDFETARGLIEAETERKESHTRAFEVLSNPDLIAEEMDRSAEATEMRIARRTTLPREDAGPSAKVYRPKIHKRYPKSWPK
jgi:hypothetical protein